MKKNRILYLVMIMALCNCYQMNGQQLKFIKNLSFEYGAHIPFADLNDRFGASFQAGGHFEFVSASSLVVIGASGHFLFGQKVKEDVLSNLRTVEGEIIGNDRQFASVFLRQRGTLGQIYLGKIFNFSKKNPASGIKATIGLGFLQHKIRVQDDSRTVTELTGEYIKGYDRLTNGLTANVFIGYQHLDRQGRLNFLAGFDITTGFTQNRRDFDFNTLQKESGNRLDGLGGFKVGWMLVLGGNKTSPETIIY